MKKVLKPFSIEAAQNGAKIVTRDGRSVRIICWNKRGDNYPIIALIERDGFEIAYIYDEHGAILIDYESNKDLMLEEVEFEDGDIIAFGDNKDKPTIGIFNYYYDLSKKRDSHNDYCQLECNGTVWHHEVGYLSNSRLATEEEKRKLFDALAKEGKRWNDNKKCIENMSKLSDTCGSEKICGYFPCNMTSDKFCPMYIKKGGLKKECEFKRGQAVLVKDDDNAIWYPAIFIDYNSYCDYVYPFITTKGTYKMCIDYDSNRELAYKQNNPE